jgi:isoleucyl-tRNA synthetase
VIAPQEIINRYGADILRLWVASTDYRNDIRISENILKNLVESYRRIRNTLRFLLGNLNDFNPDHDAVPHERMPSLDRWILSRLQRLMERVTKGYDEYAFHLPSYNMHHFCVNDLSSFYLDVSKDRLYAEATDSLERRSCQTAMWVVLKSLVKMLAPVLSFTAEEAWQEIRKLDESLPESVFLTDWPHPDQEIADTGLEEFWAGVLEVRGALSRGLEVARTQGHIGHPLEACIRVIDPGAYKKTLQSMSEKEWETIAITSGFEYGAAAGKESVHFEDEETGIELEIAKAPGSKCPRCWKYSVDVDDNGLCERCRKVLEVDHPEKV